LIFDIQPHFYIQNSLIIIRYSKNIKQMESTRRSRRHRNPQAQEAQSVEQQQPFFSKTASPSSVQSKQESAFFQPKLTIGPANDQYEKEADAVADKVVNSPSAPKGNSSDVQKQPIGSVQRMATPDEKTMPATNDGRMAEDKKIQEKPLQREAKKEEEKPVQKADKKEEEKPVQKADKKEEEKPVQKADKKEEEKPVQKADKKEEEKPVQKADKKEEEKPVQKADKKEEEKPVQKADKKEEEKKPGSKSAGKKEDDKTTKGKGVSVKEPFETRLAHIKEKGKPLPEKIRAKMEAEMHHDFSSVRIHDDATAAELAEEIHAQAFAQGHDIYFNVDKFNPETTGGAHLLAHELTHVIQQGAAPTKAQKKG
jgi:hypothetical protein